MGVFSGQRIVQLDSVVYNLAGDEETRPNYMKSLVVRNTLSGTKDSLAETFQKGYLNGPSMQFRSFFRWARRTENFGKIGMPTGSLATAGAVNTLAVANAIAEATGKSAWVQSAQIRSADYDMWVEQYILNYAPAMANTEWSADINDDGSLITIKWFGAGFTVFSPANFDFKAQYVMAYYNEVAGETLGTINYSDEVNIGTEAFPSTNGWTYEGKTELGTWSEATYSKLTYVGAVSGGASYNQQFMFLREETAPLSRQYQLASRTITGLDHSSPKVFIYKIGSGNTALDRLITPTGSLGEFFPSFPVRVNRTFLGKDTFGSTFAQTKKAFKKATGGKIEKLIEQLEDNKDLDKIDAAYVTFGVSLNVKENACKRYLFQFFRNLSQTQAGGPSAYRTWRDAVSHQEDVYDTWLTWKAAQADSDNPLYGDPEPPRPNIPTLQRNSFRVTTQASELPFQYNTDTRISWIYIEEGAGAGLGKTGAKKGECWFQQLQTDYAVQKYFSSTSAGTNNFMVPITRIRLFWQVDANTHRYLDIVGMEHSSYLYGAKATTTTAAEALLDTEESGFIIPLHYDTWKQMSLVQSSQMATACCFLVLTTYKIYKTKWYQNGFFQILIVIAIAILSVMFTGGAGIGLLGSHMAVGQALGLTGMAAAVVGSIANSLTALILVTLVNNISVGIFGPQFGAIISAVFMLVLGNMAGSFHATGSFALDWGSMLKVENLMKLTSAVGNIGAGLVGGEIEKIGVDLENLTVGAKAEAEKIQQAFFEEFGYGGGRIDPMMFVDVASSSRILAEAPDTFLTRTLMTGSEIAELSKDLISNFSEYSIKLPDAFI